MRSEWLTRFERQRQGQTLSTIEAFTPELAKTLAALRLHLSLKGDERRRYDPAHYGPIANDLKRLGVLPETTPEVDPQGLDGVPMELGEWSSSLDSDAALLKADSVARGRLSHKLEDAEYLAAHSSVFAQGIAGQDRLLRLTVPASESGEVLKQLDSYNINAFSLFQSEEALMETVAALVLRR